MNSVARPLSMAMLAFTVRPNNCGDINISNHRFVISYKQTYDQWHTVWQLIVLMWNIRTARTLEAFKQELKKIPFSRIICNANQSDYYYLLTCLLFTALTQLWADSLSRKRTNATPLLWRVSLSLTIVTLENVIVNYCRFWSIYYYRIYTIKTLHDINGKIQSLWNIDVGFVLLMLIYSAINK